MAMGLTTRTEVRHGGLPLEASYLSTEDPHYTEDSKGSPLRMYSGSDVD